MINPGTKCYYIPAGEQHLENWLACSTAYWCRVTGHDDRFIKIECVDLDSESLGDEKTVRDVELFPEHLLAPAYDE